jgi:hypothetical protein
MKRLFGVKKTVEAPSLEETTGKVINYLRALFSLFSLFSLSSRRRFSRFNSLFSNLNLSFNFSN